MDAFRPIPQLSDRQQVRFWSLVERGERDDSCWTWRGPLSRGYGQFLTFRPHRIAYVLSVGPLDCSLTLDHTCRNRACVNPAHLEPVTLKENILRGTAPTARNAKKTHCRKGHLLKHYGYDAKQRPIRRCEPCVREAHLKYQAKQKDMQKRLR